MSVFFLKDIWIQIDKMNVLLGNWNAEIVIVAIQSFLTLLNEIIVINNIMIFINRFVRTIIALTVKQRETISTTFTFFTIKSFTRTTSSVQSFL